MSINKYTLASPVTIAVSWEQKLSSKDTLDLTAFLLNESGQISEISDMVFYGTTEFIDMKLTSTKHHITIETKHNKAKQIASQYMTINLDILSENIKHIVIVISSDTEKPLDKFQKVQIAFKDQLHHEDIFQLEDNGDNVFCVSVGDIQKKNKLWTLIQETTCYAGGLDKAYEDFVPKRIRESFPSIKKFNRPTFNKEKGTMPRKQLNKESTQIHLQKQAISTLTDYSKGSNNKKISNIKKESNRGIMPHTKATTHKTDDVTNPKSPKAISTVKKSTCQNTILTSKNKTADMANRFAERQKKRNK